MSTTVPKEFSGAHIFSGANTAGSMYPDNLISGCCCKKPCRILEESFGLGDWEAPPNFFWSPPMGIDMRDYYNCYSVQFKLPNFKT